MSDAFHESSPIPIVESKAWVGSEVVYAAMYRDLLRVAFVLTGSAPAAEDVVHDFGFLGRHLFAQFFETLGIKTLHVEPLSFRDAMPANLADRFVPRFPRTIRNPWCR